MDYSDIAPYSWFQNFCLQRDVELGDISATQVCKCLDNILLKPLIGKLSRVLDIKNKIIMGIHNFLSKHRQSVVVAQNQLPETSVTSGVPQPCSWLILMTYPTTWTVKLVCVQMTLWCIKPLTQQWLFMQYFSPILYLCLYGLTHGVRLLSNVTKCSIQPKTVCPCCWLYLSLCKTWHHMWEQISVGYNSEWIQDLSLPRTSMKKGPKLDSN